MTDRSHRRPAAAHPPARPGSAAAALRSAVAESLERRTLLATFVVTSAADAGPGTLRQAILDANADPAADAIHFDLGGGGVQTIRPASNLPTLAGPVTIDGTTQPGYAGTPLVELAGDRSFSPFLNIGLRATAPGVTVRGLAINRFASNVRLDGTGAVFQGNYVGLAPDGSPRLVADGTGVDAGGSGSLIGGTRPGDGNVIAGPTYGLRLYGSDQRVEGNRIGTTPDGTAVLPAGQGVQVREGVIVENVTTGPVPTGNRIGGTDPAARNVIAGWADGVAVRSMPVGTVIQGNYIGTDVTGTRPLPNGDGIELGGLAGTLVGGTEPGAGNVIAGNSRNGVLATRSHNSPESRGRIQGNRIGVGADGRPLGNTWAGVHLDNVGGLLVGGIDVGAGNEIAFNAGAGVRSTLSFQPAAGGNLVRGNSIHDNDGPGIAVEQVEASPRPTVGYAPPVGGDSAITVSVRGEPTTAYAIDVYVSPVPAPSGFGEGRTRRAAVIVTTDAAGDAAAVVPFRDLDPSPGRYVTATATDLSPAGGAGTGPFSNAYELTAEARPPAPATPDLPATDDSGASATDDLTNVAAPTFVGTAPAGAAVRLVVDRAVAGTAVAGPDGRYAIAPAAPLADGPRYVSAVYEVAGRWSDPATPVRVTVDTARPTLIAQLFGPSSATAPVAQLSLFASEPLAGLSAADLTLTRDGDPSGNLLGPGQSVREFGAGMFFDLVSLASPTTPLGTYRVGTVPVPAATDRAGNLLLPAAELVFARVPPLAAAFDRVAPDPRAAAVEQAVLRFNRPVAFASLFDVTLTRDGVAVPLPAAARLSPSGSPDGSADWALTGLAGATAAPGAYLLRFYGAVLDGNTRTYRSAEVVFRVAPPLAVTFGLVDPGPRPAPADQVRLSFSEHVSGLDLSDLVLSRDGGPNLLGGQSGAAVYAAGSSFVLYGLTGLTIPPATYTLSFAADSQLRLGGDGGDGATVAGPADALTFTVTAPLSADIVDVQPRTRVSPVGAIDVRFDRPVSEFDLADLTLGQYPDGPNLLAAAAGHALTSADGGTTWTLSGLAAATAAPTAYRVAFAGEALVRDAGGAPRRVSGQAAEFSVVRTPVATLGPVSGTPPVGWVPVSFSDHVHGLDPSDFVLTRDGVAVPLGAGQGVFASTPTRFQVRGLEGLTAEAGTYVLAFAPDASAFVGMNSVGAPPAGEAFRPTGSVAWTVAPPPLTVDVVDVAPDPRTVGVGAVEVRFSRPVTGFDLSDVTLFRAGLPVPLGAAAVVATADAQSYRVEGLLPVAGDVGAYRLAVWGGAASGIAASDGLPLEYGADDTWTVVAPPTTTRQVRAAQDTYARDGAAAGTNYGQSGVMEVRRSSVAGSSRQGYLTFDVAAGANPAASVRGAKLRVWGRLSGTGYVDVAAYRVPADGWAEGSVNWNNKPATNGYAGGMAAAVGSTAGRWYEFDLTTYVQDLQQRGVSRVSVALLGQQFTSGHAAFNTDEAAANRPELVLTEAVVPTLLASSSQVSVREGGAAQVSVRLSGRPQATTTVTLAWDTLYGKADPTLGFAPAALTFTPENWDVPQAVTVSAAHDANTTGGSGLLEFAAPYHAGQAVRVTLADDDVPAATKTLRASADAYVRDGSYVARNFGSAADLQVRKSSYAGNSRQTVLKFDLSTVTTVSQATLRLYGRLDSTANPSVAVQAFAASSTTWTETGVTWNNKPAATGASLGQATVAGTANRWYAIDLTAWLRAQKAAGRTTAALVLASPLATTATALFAGDEAAANRPELVVRG